jgi:asparagine synthase (glutamine-hydrolysing)
MAELLRHRGPDEGGEAVFDVRDGSSVVLAHRRLSIIDLPGGHQPQTSEDGTINVIFNGEIYNFRELRADLERAGHRFATRSDTEVLVHLYEEHGDDFVHLLRGMFAFALWDARHERLLLARDRLGVKPLYWARPDGDISLAWSSELKALLRVPGVSSDLDLESVASYLAYLYVPHPRTIVTGAQKLSPGHLLVWQGGRAEVSRYWEPPAESAPVEPGEEERLWQLIEDAVGARLVADVDVGAFLSGGIDSSTIVAAATARSSAPPDTFTVVFPEQRSYDESADAREVSRAFRTAHHEFTGSVDAAALLPEIVRHFDEPFGNPTSLLVYELSRLTRQHVKVALAGDGADELFAGYPRFRGIAAAARYRRVPRPVRAAAAAGARLLPESTEGRHSLRRAREFALAPLEHLDDAYLSWITYFDPARRAALFTDAANERLRESPAPERFLEGLFDRAPKGDLVNRLSYVELQSFLPCNTLEYGDKMSMAHGLEVRSPFTDHRLVEHVLPLPGSLKLRGGRSKAILRRAVAGHLPARPVAKRKLGFNPPMGVWLRHGLAPLVDDYLGREQVEARGLFRPEAVESLLSDLRGGRRDVSLHVWSLIVLEQWFREYGSTS